MNEFEYAAAQFLGFFKSFGLAHALQLEICFNFGFLVANYRVSLSISSFCIQFPIFRIRFWIFVTSCGCS